MVLIAAGCANPPAMPEAPAVAPPVPAGQARIWFYRDWEPSESLNLANRDVNGSYFGSVANGGVFYGDVSPGHYHITPQSYGQDFNQDQDVDLALGQQVYCSVVSLRSWEEGGTWRSSSGTRSISGWCHAGGTDRNPPEPRWYLRVWCAGSGSKTKAFELRPKRRRRG